MADHPTTFKAEPAGPDRIEWDDGAAIHRKDDGDGVFEAMKALHRGTLAEMVAMIRTMPADQRSDFVIQKAGDRRFEADEIMQLADRPDFPG